MKTSELRPGTEVLLKGEIWKVLSVRPGTAGGIHVIVKKGDRKVGREFSPDKTWPVVHPVPVATAEELQDAPDEWLTVQDYLLGCGMDPVRLETAARSFGSTVGAAWRKRHGKFAVCRKKLEYVAYLDTTKIGPWALPAAQSQESGWYRSNAYGPDDRDILDLGRELKFPELGPYRGPLERAKEVLEAHGFEIQEHTDGMMEFIGYGAAHSDGHGGTDLVWLAEEQMKRCESSPVPCQHELCQRRRGRRWRSQSDDRYRDMLEVED